MSRPAARRRLPPTIRERCWAVELSFLEHAPRYAYRCEWVADWKAGGGIYYALFKTRAEARAAIVAAPHLSRAFMLVRTVPVFVSIRPDLRVQQTPFGKEKPDARP